jgi:hypothetical protein
MTTAWTEGLTAGPWRDAQSPGPHSSWCTRQMLSFPTMRLLLAADLMGRVLIVQCSSTTADAWLGLVQRVRHRPASLFIKPRGGIHPLRPPRERLQ